MSEEVPGPSEEDLAHQWRALTIKGVAVADAVLDGVKRVESRTWRIPDGFYALHVGASPPDARVVAQVRALHPERKEPVSTSSAVCGLVRIVGSGGVDACGGDPWATGPVCHHLRVAIRLPAPVATKGKLGVWRLPHEVSDAVWSGLCDVLGADISEVPRGLRRWAWLDRKVCGGADGTSATANYCGRRGNSFTPGAAPSSDGESNNNTSWATIPPHLPHRATSPDEHRSSPQQPQQQDETDVESPLPPIASIAHRWCDVRTPPSSPRRRPVPAYRRDAVAPRDLDQQPISKYEIAKVLGMRALQLSCGMPPAVPVDMSLPPHERSSAAIARRELRAGLIRFHVCRDFPDGSTDSVSVNAARLP